MWVLISNRDIWIHLRIRAGKSGFQNSLFYGVFIIPDKSPYTCLNFFMFETHIAVFALPKRVVVKRKYNILYIKNSEKKCDRCFPISIFTTIFLSMAFSKHKSFCIYKPTDPFTYTVLLKIFMLAFKMKCLFLYVSQHCQKFLR